MATNQALDASRGTVARHRDGFTRRIPAMGGLGLLLALVLAALLASSAQAQSVGLGTADSFAVLGGSTVTNTGPSVISGDLGVSPGSAVSGFPPGTVIAGSIHANDAVAAQAQLDLTTAYNDAAGRSSTSTVSGDLAGRTLTAGVYTSATSLGLSGDLTLDGQGDPNAVFIFQAGSTLTTAAGSRVLITGGAQACNVFWQVGSSATIGSATSFTGSILALTSISLTTGATLDGRALARNGAVTLDTNLITRTACATPTPSPDGTPPGTTPPGTSPGTTPPGTTPVVVPRRRGTARLVPGPRTGPRRGPPRAGRCASKPFTVRVTGRRIRQVAFFVNGRRLGTVRARPGRTVFAMRIDPRRQNLRAHRVTVRVRFTAASRTPTKTLRLTYQRCQPVQPRFTG
ncbi:MAG: DUF3494 domain-containing protein [Solirubrobacteraceae bacterium]|nr:DUF3494 domain-containing protein [Solirubrobacteraceae bacterium]